MFIDIVTTMQFLFISWYCKVRSKCLPQTQQLSIRHKYKLNVLGRVVRCEHHVHVTIVKFVLLKFI